MPEIQFLNNEIEIGALIKYPDDSKTEFSFLRETLVLSLSQFSYASADFPDQEYTMALLEIQTLAKLLAMPEIASEIEEE